ncbi:hypothetical protein [Zophobihabitans entericus]|uniref:Uncharacterized protein n=1 Tax=Zophobihabitans entericus TaxID=1635327 RepID=A0A6G9IAQ7_9GAMM|nr:hypothetical protein [Zophobihabitans entericus]QIQ20660.1 hypothetical protein IPMB12_02565 [Zophobihabitans entericus]
MQQTNSIFKLPILVNIAYIVTNLVMMGLNNPLSLTSIARFLSGYGTILHNLLIFIICCLFFNQYRRYTLSSINIITALIIGVIQGLLYRLVNYGKMIVFSQILESGDTEQAISVLIGFSAISFIPSIIITVFLCLIFLPLTHAGQSNNSTVSSAAAKNRFLYLLLTVAIYFCISQFTINLISILGYNYGYSYNNSSANNTEYVYYSMICNVICGLIIFAVTYTQFPGRLTKVYSGKIVGGVLLSFLLQFLINIILAILLFFMFINNFRYSIYYGIDPAILVAVLAIVILSFIVTILINYMMTKRLFSRLEPQSNQIQRQTLQSAQLIS